MLNLFKNFFDLSTTSQNCLKKYILNNRNGSNYYESNLLIHFLTTAHIYSNFI